MPNGPAKHPTFSPEYCTFMFWAQTVAGIILISGLSFQIALGRMPSTTGMTTLVMIFVWTICGLAVWLATAGRK